MRRSGPAASEKKSFENVDDGRTDDGYLYILKAHLRGRTGLVVPDRETRVRFSAGSVCCFLEQETFTPQKVLVIRRNRWLRLNMTEKLFTGTLNHNQNKNKTKAHIRAFGSGELK